MSDRTCDVGGCELVHYARGYCRLHWARWNRWGTTDLRVRPALQERFWARVNKTDSCWLWTGCSSSGYGTIYADGRTAYTHRLSYQWAKGSIPDGLHLDHLCRVRLCVNPDHLEPVTVGENIARGMAPTAVVARTGLCQRGHSMDDAYIRPQGGRMCRTCCALRRERRKVA